MRTVGVIPARGGSRGIPRKNLALLGGQPLVTWTIQAATCSVLDRVVVSSDDPDIRAVAAQAGAEAVDQPRASDVSTSAMVIEDVLAMLADGGDRPDVVVLLHPTSPFRTAADIDACLARVLDDGYPAAVSLTVPDRHPYLVVDTTPDGRVWWTHGLPDLPPRQQLPDAHAINGAVYAARTDYFERYGFMGPATVGYVMPPERSLDIDTPWDLSVARAIVDANERRRVAA